MRKMRGRGDLFGARSLVDLRNHNCDNDDDDDDEQNNEQAPPLLAVPAARLLDCAADLGVGLDDVVVDLLALLLDVGDEGFLLLHDLVQVLEQLGELDHLALDVLDRVVALFDIAKGGRGLAATVGVEELYSLLVTMMKRVKFDHVQLAGRWAHLGLRPPP